MAENLNTGTYRNGDPIPTGLSDYQWNTAGASSGIFGVCANFNNNEQNSCPFGKLYNFYAVTDPRNLCPTGWHVPTDDEWTILTSFLGGEEIAGGKMKSTGLQYWNSPNQDASNESGFSGLAGGMRYNFGLFDLSGFFGLWWSSTSLDGGGLAWFRSLSYSTDDVQRGNNSWEFGYSIRCIRD